MKLVARARQRFRLALRGYSALGEFYRPTLSSIHLSGAQIQVAVDPLIPALGLQESTSEAVPRRLVNQSTQLFPDLYDSGDLTREALWRIVLATRPDVVVETGVANGHSSQTILRALEFNGKGRLHSFDVDPRTSTSVPTELRQRWSFTTLNAQTAMQGLKSSIRSINGHVDMWFHDSDHNYAWQRSEFDLAKEFLSPGGVLVSDDVDGTDAFADFCLRNPDWKAVALFDTRKVCGFARKPTETLISLGT